MLKVDFHTHSSASRDGGISSDAYRQLLDSGKLDYIAVTDHNRIDLAQALHRELGPKIIVGEEINTTEGELIGLFLTEKIEPGQSARDTAEAIHRQGGLVYLPHPFETVRHGLQAEAIDTISDHIDIVEGHNGRAVFQNRSSQAVAWAKLHQKPLAASSDAHGARGVGYTYTVLNQAPTKDQLLATLEDCQLVHHRPPLLTLAYPKLHRVRNKLRKRHA